MHFGDIEILYLDGGTFWLDGGAMFGVVPKPMWEKKCASDERNRIRLRANSLLVRAGGKNILVETGNGTKWDAKLRNIYGIEEGDPLIKSLAATGAAPEDIDVVINTHLHFDHAGGNTRISAGKAVATFRNAEYIVQRGELEHARKPTERDRASYFADNFEPISNSTQWRLTEGDQDIFPGISVEKIPGHNADIQAVKISGGGKTAVFVADLFPTRHHIPLPWMTGYDLYPLTTLETKRRWLSEIVAKEWVLVFGHDPEQAAATLHERDGKIHYEPFVFER
jgi:glyoxylase-like metal-dependent hydrolase (beta-lactamase superfamily II)